MTQVVVHIEPTPPFDFSLVRRYLQFNPRPSFHFSDDGAMSWLVRRDGRAFAISLSASGISEYPGLLVQIKGDSAQVDVTDAIITAIRHAFGTERNLSEMYRTLEADPVASELVSRYRGFQPASLPDLFEVLVITIIGQQISIEMAARCQKAILQRFGEYAEILGTGYELFPSPAIIASLAESDFVGLPLTKRKVRSIIGVARTFLDNPTFPEIVLKSAPEEGQALLETLSGVGPWTARYALLACAGHTDILPVGDVPLRRAVGRVYQLGRPATEEEVRSRSEAWTGWRGYVAAYLWLDEQMTRPVTQPLHIPLPISPR